MHQRSTHQKHQQKQQQQKQQKKQQQQQKSLRARLAEEMIRDANDPDAYLLPPVVKIDMRTGLSDLELLNDMAILTLAEPVNFTTTLAPVRISSRVVPELETYTVAGWGQLDNFEFPSFLMKTAVASGRRMDCGIANSMYRGPKGPLICTGRSNGCGLCRGDIGAPLLDIAPNFPRSIKPQKPSNSSSTETAQIVHQQPLTESAFSGGSLGNGYYFILSGVATGYYRPNGLTAVNNDRPMREQGVAWCNGTTMMHYYANPMFDIGWISTVTGVPTKDLTEGDDSFVPDYGTVDDDPNPVGFYWGIGIMCIAALAFMAWMFSRRRKRHRTD
ncbi:trypsin-like serine protease [Ramicandelaber brevisporus]|nr:trypsin-like serine protease [Ramicandelaber brevisporus]